jgi:hypothetical protein
MYMKRGTPMTISRLLEKPIVVVALIVLVLSTFTAALFVHSFAANVYCELNLQRLQMAADLAVRAGVQYLPREPRTAVQVAATYAENTGIAFNEIVLVRVDADKLTLRIQLNRKVPIYLALFATGWPRGEIAVTASAQQRSDRREAPLREISWVLGWVPLELFAL